MSLLLSKKWPSQCAAQCPDCGVTLSRLSDMNRHRRNKHPNGTETKFRCPWHGCAFQSILKANVTSHFNTKHCNGSMYPCPECARSFSDSTSRIRHRKKMHGYVPYHTAEYLARQARARNESVVQEPSNAVSNENRLQPVVLAPSAASEVTLGESSSWPPAAHNPFGVPYHNNFWNMPTDITPLYAPQAIVPLSVPSETLPGYDTLNTILPPAAESQSTVNYDGAIAPSDFTTHYDYSNYDSRSSLYNVEPQQYQEQVFEESFPFTGDYGVPYNGNAYNGNGQWDWPSQ